jgi:CheY-like chemotaxis protein
VQKNGRNSVLVVEDNPVMRLTIHLVLEDTYEVLEAESGADCLMQVAQFVPDLILMDIEMPGMDGYQACQNLREDGYNMPIVFVSTKGSVSERLRAFELGADDFVVKPFDGEILLHKVNRILAPHVKTSELALEKKTMQSMAMELLTINGEGKELIGFLIKHLNCQHYEDLAKSFVALIRGYGIDCLFEIRHADGVTRQKIGDSISSLDESLLGGTEQQLGLFFYKGRLLINSHTISLLIPNMPEQQDLAVRLKDNLVTLINATESLVHSISIRREATLTTESLQVAALNAHETTAGLHSAYHQQQADTQILLHGLIEKVEKQYFSMGLTESQEARISNILRHEAGEILDLFRHGAESLEERFSSIMSALAPAKKDSGDVWL